MGWVGRITNAGVDMIHSFAAGGHTLNITRASVGSGTVPEADLRVQTAVTNEKMDASIITSSVTGVFDFVKYAIQVGPATFAVGAFTAHQIGLWATLDDDTEETLLVLVQDSDTGVSVPEETASPKFAFCMYVVVPITDSDNIVVNIDSSAYVDMLTLEQMLDEIKGNPKHLRGEFYIVDPEETGDWTTNEWKSGTWTAEHDGHTRVFTAPSGMYACALYLEGVTKDSAIVRAWIPRNEANVKAKMEYDTYDDGWIMISTATLPSGEFDLYMDII